MSYLETALEREIKGIEIVKPISTLEVKASESKVCKAVEKLGDGYSVEAGRCRGGFSRYQVSDENDNKYSITINRCGSRTRVGIRYISGKDEESRLEATPLSDYLIFLTKLGESIGKTKVPKTKKKRMR